MNRHGAAASFYLATQGGKPTPLGDGFCWQSAVVGYGNYIHIAKGDCIYENPCAVGVANAVCDTFADGEGEKGADIFVIRQSTVNDKLNAYIPCAP